MDENADFSCLLDYSAGGVLRSYNYKPISASLLNAWRNDGEPSLAFLDCLLPNMDMTPGQIERALAGRESLLKDPNSGFVSLKDNAIKLVEEGKTTGEEVLRVIYEDI